MENDLPNMYEKKDPESLGRVPSNAAGEVDTIAHDAVFGEITEGGPNYRNVREVNLQNRD